MEGRKEGRQTVVVVVTVVAVVVVAVARVYN